MIALTPRVLLLALGLVDGVSIGARAPGGSMCVQRSDPVLKGLMNLRGGSNLDLLTTEEELDYELGAAGAGVLVVVDFMAEWCGPCKKLAPTLEALAERTAPTGKCKFFAVDVDQARELAAAKDVKSMPTILFYRDGKLVKRVVGADVAAIKAEVDKATMNPLMKLLKSETVALMTMHISPRTHSAPAPPCLCKQLTRHHPLVVCLPCATRTIHDLLGASC